jgi:hypothetical protein
LRVIRCQISPWMTRDHGQGPVLGCGSRCYGEKCPCPLKRLAPVDPRSWHETSGVQPWDVCSPYQGAVGVAVMMGVAVLIGVGVALTGVSIGVAVVVGVAVTGMTVAVMVGVGVGVGVGVIGGVAVVASVGVLVGVAVMAVIAGVGVLVGVAVVVGSVVMVGWGDPLCVDIGPCVAVGVAPTEPAVMTPWHAVRLAAIASPPATSAVALKRFVKRSLPLIG